MFTAIVHFLVLPQIGGTRRALGLVLGLNPAYIALAIAFEVAELLACAQISRALLPPVNRPRPWP